MQSNRFNLNTLQILLVITALITAVVHVVYGIASFPDALGILLVFNGIGYIGLTGAYLLPINFFLPYRPAIRWVLMGYAVITIVSYFVVWGTQIDAVGVITKLDEIGLIILVWLSGRR